MLNVEVFDRQLDTDQGKSTDAHIKGFIGLFIRFWR